MKYAIADLPEDAEVTNEGDIATVIIGGLTFKAQSIGDDLILFPDRSVKQRDFLKMMGRIFD